jgi:hypothetical protein
VSPTLRFEGKNQTRNQFEAVCAYCLLRAAFFIRLLFNSEDGVDIFLRNVDFQRTTQPYIPEDRILRSVTMGTSYSADTVSLNPTETNHSEVWRGPRDNNSNSAADASFFCFPILYSLIIVR